MRRSETRLPNHPTTTPDRRAERPELARSQTTEQTGSGELRRRFEQLTDREVLGHVVTG
jgi:hypothetical protein